MSQPVTFKDRIGAVFSLIGSVFLFLAVMWQLYSVLGLGTTYYTWISIALTSFWSVLGLVGSIKCLRGNVRGFKYCLVAGIGDLFLVGFFFPITICCTTYIYFSTSLFGVVDPLLVLVGGILWRIREGSSGRSKPVFFSHVDARQKIVSYILLAAFLGVITYLFIGLRLQLDLGITLPEPPMFSFMFFATTIVFLVWAVHLKRASK